MKNEIQNAVSAIVVITTFRVNDPLRIQNTMYATAI